MRVAALYDVHGNLPALEAVLAEVDREDVDAVVVGGDVLWGPLQAECLDALRSLDALYVAGNCEREVLAAVNESSAWCRAQLDEDDLAFVSGWPLTVELQLDGLRSTVFCHATPRSDKAILTRTTPEEDVAAALTGVDADVVVCGHTHVQYDRQAAGTPRLVNAGSVGLPYQGEPGAYWALLGPEVVLRRTTYDVDAALASLATSEFPSAADIFGDSLRGTASAESATAYFESKRAKSRRR
jgi:putative phosphoesterase